MKHWATPLIGKPWLPNAQGPDAFDCWGLVRHVFEVRYGLAIPEIGSVAAMKQAADVSGWRRVDDKPEDGDVVLMQGPAGRHVGVMIATARGLRLLHSDGSMGAAGPFGSVVAVPLETVQMGGYSDFELWRLAR